MKRYGAIGAFLLAGAAFATAPNISKVNGSVSVAAGQSVSGVTTVNGAIRIADNARATNVRTVNGSITLGTSTSVQSLHTVNGSISLGTGARVSGTIASVNGAITLERAADVSGRLANVNGRIHLDAAHVGGGIETVSGDIEVGPGSRVEGGILVRNSCSPGWWSWLFGGHCRPSSIVIGPDAVVQGKLQFEHEVKLYVSDRARIGPVEGAAPITYSGDQPP